MSTSTLRKDLLNPSLMEVLETFRLDKQYVQGKGAYLTDEAGKVYLDFIAQYGAVPFGYNPDFIWDALLEVRNSGIPSLVQPSVQPEALRLASQLAEVTPGDLCYCTFCQSGTEAVEAAFKLARSTTKRASIVSTSNSFHGKTLGSLSATGKDSYQTPFCAPVPGFERIPYNDLEALQRIFEQKGDEIAAFIVEPIQGEGGIHVAKPGYLAAARELCTRYGAVFILDEIQTGLGRTGSMFCCEREGIEPDVLLLAKAIGGGLLPLGVCISSPRVWNEDFGMLHSSTFANNNVTCAVGNAVLDYLLVDEQQFIRDVHSKGQYLLGRLEELARAYPDVIKEVRGQGLMIGVEFHTLVDCGSFDMAYIEDQGGFTALLAGFLLNVFNIRLAPFLNNSTTLRLEPPLIIEYDEMDRMVEALSLICKIIHYRDFAKLYRFLIGDYTVPVHINDYRSQSRSVQSSVLQDGETAEQKYAFIVHYPAPEDVVLNNPSFASYSREELYQFMAWEAQNSDPGLVCHMPALKSADGQNIAEGWLIGIPYGAREIMDQEKRDVVVDTIARAVDKGQELGAGIVGLGALTSVVTRGGRAVTGRDVAVTSGNSFTTLMAVEALFLGAEKMELEPIAVHAGVVGATGSIGRACAMMVSERVCQMTLFGNPKHQVSSRNRLASLSRDIFQYAWQRMKSGYLEGMSAWYAKVLALLQKRSERKAHEYYQQMVTGNQLSAELMMEICEYLKIDYPLSTSIDIAGDLPACDLVIATSNSPEYLIRPQDVRSGAVVCDVARPADVDPRILEERNDVLVLEGGLVQLPEKVNFGPNLGYRDGVTLACLSETILLALEGDYQDYSIGQKLSLDTVHYLRTLAQKHGFTLAGLKMGNREISDQDIEEIYRNSLSLQKAGDL